MGQAVDVHRLHFAFTITFHYIFPQLTMGLALLLVYLKTKALRTGDEHYNRAARFWARIFGINFALGVVTGIPMEFQFGTNWLRFQKRRAASSAKHWRWKACFRFSRIELPGAVFVRREKTRTHGTLVVGVSSYFSARGSRAISSLRRTPGCNIRPVTGLAPTGPSNSPASGISC